MLTFTQWKLEQQKKPNHVPQTRNAYYEQYGAYCNKWREQNGVKLL